MAMVPWVQSAGRATRLRSPWHGTRKLVISTSSRCWVVIPISRKKASDCLAVLPIMPMITWVTRVFSQVRSSSLPRPILLHRYSTLVSVVSTTRCWIATILQPPCVPMVRVALPRIRNGVGSPHLDLLGMWTKRSSWRTSSGLKTWNCVPALVLWVTRRLATIPSSQLMLPPIISLAVLRI